MRKKGTKNKVYSAEFKINVIMDVRENHLGYNEAERKYSLPHSRIQKWERIYLEEGAEGLMKERQGKACRASWTKKGGQAQLDTTMKEFH